MTLHRKQLKTYVAAEPYRRFTRLLLSKANDERGLAVFFFQRGAIS